MHKSYIYERHSGWTDRHRVIEVISEKHCYNINWALKLLLSLEIRMIGSKMNEQSRKALNNSLSKLNRKKKQRVLTVLRLSVPQGFRVALL